MGKIEDYRDLTHKMNKNISIINKEFNNEVITDNGFKALDDLEKQNREYIKLCKEIKDNPYSYKQEDINIINKDMMAYKNMILNAKKIFIYNYNKVVFSIKSRLDSIKNKVNTDIIYKDKLILLDSIKEPKYLDKFISNYQDKIELNFKDLYDILNSVDKLEKRVKIEKLDNELMTLSYIDKYVLKQIDKNIDNYGIDKNITKTSIENDILYVMYELDLLKEKHINLYYPDKLTYVTNALNDLKIKLSRKRLNKKDSIDNQEYYDLKDDLNFFLREVENLHMTLFESGEEITDFKLKEVRDKLATLNDRYNNLPERIKNDKVLNDNLLEIFDKITNEIGYFVTKKEKDKLETLVVEEPKDEKIESDSSKETDKETSKDEVEENKEDTIDAEYEVVDTRDGKGIYKKFGKHVLLSSAIATLALLIPGTAPFAIPAIIVGNIAIMDKEPIMNKINNILGKSIGAKKDKTGGWFNSLGKKIDKKSALSGLMKGAVVNGESKPKTAGGLIGRIKDLANMMPSEEYIKTIKEKRDRDVEKEVIKLYNKYVNSGKGLRKFCNDEMVPESMVKRLANYIISEAEEASKGRTR